MNTEDVCVSNHFCASNPGAHECTLSSKPHVLSMIECEKPDSSLCNGDRGIGGSIFYGH